MNASQPAESTITVGKNELLMRRARQCLAGGENSTMRALPYHLPLVADRGEGCRVWDIEGREYIDLNMAYGPLIFGHRPARLVEAVIRQVGERGGQLGFPAEISVEVAEKLKRLFPTMELLRFSSTGSEAIAAAIRLARTVTGRSTIIGFEGHYHGSSEAVFHRYHAPLEQLPREGFGPAVPGTLGMNGAPHDLVVARWNQLDVLERCVARHADRLAAIIMEPVMGNAGVIPPDPQFLAAAREMAFDRGALLIFDEVITGMRVAAGGAQQRYGVYPDITVLSKALGGGLPISAFGASRELMDTIARGELFHGGVYSGNAMAMAGADAVLSEILENGPAIYSHLEAIGDQLERGVSAIFTRLGIAHCLQRVGPLLSIFLTRDDVDELTEYRSVRFHCDHQKYIRFQHQLQQSGVYFHPNQFEPLFLSTAHMSEDIDEVLERIEEGAKCCLVN
jgi:glutamate-1-semialdehyde 2,1-aminomutase